MEHKEPLVSVIVPVYNGQDYLADCIDSIENQTYGNLEVIIINDGSTDGTVKVCDSLRASYENVRVLTMDDRGVSAARNAGIEESTGELVTFVDADDRLRPEMLRILYDCMTETESDIAGCRFFAWSSEAEWERTAGLNTSGTDRARTDAAAEQAKVYDARTYLQEELLHGNSRCWSKLYRRAVVDQVRFVEGLTIGEDMLFLVKILPFAKRIAETGYSGYGYYWNPAGAINREFTPRYMDQITCWKLARQEILHMNPDLDSQVTALGIMGIMLTAGKLAMLPADKRRDNAQYIGICHEELKEAMKIPGTYGWLSVGYRLKSAIFRVSPNLYLGLYHLHKGGL
ncbi:MAG: glycosyltransferase [Eubacterium sp.]|nr:glycosyltransferase [Eubacterium sp.]